MKPPVLAAPVVVTALLLTVLGGVPASAVVLAPTDCPTALPTGEAVDGLSATGFTVERGTTPEPFTAAVLGRIDDGIAPGVDLIMADLTSPALTRSGGVWAGMSGSPVYADDGRLVGAVAYVLASNTSIAGITPAEAMLPLAGPSAGAQVRAAAAASDPAQTVTPTPQEARELAATGATTYTQARAGFELLDVPLAASGTRGKHSRSMLERMSERLDLATTPRNSGAAAPVAQAAPEDITAGSNFAAALSYGDVTFAGTGTTTLVCDGVAVAFGHPFFGTGETTMSMHPATAVLVQPDSLFGSFKVANPGGVVGTVDTDATAGIAGPVGLIPETTTVSTSFTTPSGAQRTGSTEVVLGDVVADIAAFQAQSSVDSAYGAQSAGSAAFTVEVDLRREDGTLDTVTRSDRVASRSALTDFPVSFLVADSVYFLLAELTQQDLEAVTVEDVRITGTLSTRYDAYTLRTVERRQVNPFAPLQPFTLLRAGRPLDLRIGVTQPGSSTVRTTVMSVPIPADASGGAGVLEVIAGPEAQFLLPEEPPATFDELLEQLRSRPGAASVAVLLTYDTESGETGQVVVTKLLKSAINPAFRSYEVAFR